MNAKLNLTILTALFAIMTGCVTHPRGPAYGHEGTFRQQIEESKPVKKWEYKVQDVRFSDDYQKALVVFVTKRGQQNEVILTDDGFGRYRGLASRADVGIAFGAGEQLPPETITVTLPRK